MSKQDDFTARNARASENSDGTESMAVGRRTVLAGGVGVVATTAVGAMTATQARSQSTDVSVAPALEWLASGLVGKAGVAARLVDGGPVLSLNAQELFPMASTVKTPIAMALLQRVDDGTFQLNTLAEIDDAEWVFGHTISSTFLHSGVALSIANLIELMITTSDNTSTDVCLRLLGGPDAVQQYVSGLGLTDFNVNSYMRDLMADLDTPTGRTNMQVAAEMAMQPGVMDMSAEYEANPNDQATPTSMLELMLKLDKGEAGLTPESTNFLLGVMSRTTAGSNRIPGLLPDRVRVEHKSGSNVGVANDVGLVTLPDDRKLALAIFTKSSNTPMPARERAISEIARYLFDIHLYKS